MAFRLSTAVVMAAATNTRVSRRFGSPLEPFAMSLPAAVNRPSFSQRFASTRTAARNPTVGRGGLGCGGLAPLGAHGCALGLLAPARVRLIRRAVAGRLAGGLVSDLPLQALVAREAVRIEMAIDDGVHHGASGFGFVGAIGKAALAG